MKVIGINGSPRKHYNTYKLCEKVLEGAEKSGAETELINLYDYNFKGCVSCFACHLKKRNDQYVCSYKDELKEILEKCVNADAIVIGTPIYYGSITGETQSFLERLLFAADTYYINEKGERVSKLKKQIKTLMIYTMNVPKEMDYFNGEDQLKIMRDYITNIIGPCEAFYAYDTCQFKNYDLYLNNMFDPEHKKERLEEQFPQECEKAYQIGEKLLD